MLPKIAVIGCGYWGKNHITTLNKLGCLAAVCDINFEIAQNFAKQYDVPALTFDDLCKNSAICAVTIALPPHLHAQHIIKAIESGKDVLVEKPIALDLEEARAAIEVAKKHNKILMVGHLLRFHPAYEKLLQFVEDSAIGEVQYIAAHRLGFGKFHKKMDALWDLGPHDLSMMLPLVKSNIVSLHKETGHITNSLANLTHLHMNFANGAKGHLYVSRLNPYIERRLTIIGDKGMLVFDDSLEWHKKISLYNYDINYEENPIFAEKAEAVYHPVEAAMPLTRELEHFIDVISNKTMLRTNGEDALKIIELLSYISK